MTPARKAALAERQEVLRALFFVEGGGAMGLFVAWARWARLYLIADFRRRDALAKKKARKR